MGMIRLCQEVFWKNTALPDESQRSLPDQSCQTRNRSATRVYVQRIARKRDKHSRRILREDPKDHLR